MLEIDKTLLVFVDVQEKLFRVMHDKETLLSNLQKLLQGIRILGIPVLVTEQYPQGLGPTLPGLATLIPDFQPLPKVCFSCWADDEFRARLAAFCRPQILLCGIEGHVCVYQTARDLVDQGFETYFVSDAISSRTPENRLLSFEMMKQAGSLVTGTEAALFELLKAAGSDQFKKISQIVK